jgi:IS30 family transposase
VSEWKQQQLDRQARFWEFIRLGWTNTACEAVGVERHQGYRWRKATGGRIPSPPRSTSGRYLWLEERLRIADLHLGGATVGAIAIELGRSPSTVSRELTRNGPGADSKGRAKYAPYAAQKRADLRARRPKASKFDHAELATVVQGKLCVKWSPEQIGLHLAEAFPDREEMQMSHETTLLCLSSGRLECC